MEYYNDFGSWLRGKFPFRVQKLSVDAGFSCPNRDGKVGWAGCTFCDNSTFNPSYCDRSATITAQLEAGKRFFSHKYPEMRYLAYFQAYTNTYADLYTLQRMYEEALSVDGVVGIVIGTRPDCVDEPLLDYLAKLARQTFVIVEYGIESANNETLLRINRGHTFECSKQAISETAERGITTCGHIIIGLPWENETEILRQARLISDTKLHILKLHQLQIIRGTQLEREYQDSPFRLFSVEEYINLLTRYIPLLRPDLILERFTSQAPASKVLAPRWGLKNHEFTNLLRNRLKTTNLWQGKLYKNEL